MNNCKKNPFSMIENFKAFAPMFQEDIIISFKENNETKKQTIRCCIFTDNMSDPYEDNTMDTNFQQIHISCMREDWKFLKNLKRGDTVVRPSINKKYSIQKVDDDFNMGIVITAREK